MQLILQGKILTPIVSKKTEFVLMGCKVIITTPRRRYINKINTGKPMFPYSLICYLGDLELQYFCKNSSKAKHKLAGLLKIHSIGRFASEGLGKIQWFYGYIDSSDKHVKKLRRYQKLKIRKGLPHYLPEEIQKLIQYAVLHDFFHTSKHKSKIYVEPELEDLELMELLRQHHEETDHPLIQTFQKYDRIAARITRKIRSPRNNRYNWYSTENIDFKQLAKEIKEVYKNVWKLYNNIYTNKELKSLNESLEHGHTSLRNHLLIISNLIVQDFQHNRLEEYFCT